MSVIHITVLVCLVRCMTFLTHPSVYGIQPESSDSRSCYTDNIYSYLKINILGAGVLSHHNTDHNKLPSKQTMNWFLLRKIFRMNSFRKIPEQKSHSDTNLIGSEALQCSKTLPLWFTGLYTTRDQLNQLLRLLWIIKISQRSKSPNPRLKFKGTACWFPSKVQDG